MGSIRECRVMECPVAHSDLSFHLHLHCVVTSAGFAPKDDSWIACLPGVVLPVRVLSRRVSTLFLYGLVPAFWQGWRLLDRLPSPPPSTTTSSPRARRTGSSTPSRDSKDPPDSFSTERTIASSAASRR